MRKSVKPHDILTIEGTCDPLIPDAIRTVELTVSNDSNELMTKLRLTQMTIHKKKSDRLKRLVGLVFSLLSSLESHSTSVGGFLKKSWIC